MDGLFELDFFTKKYPQTRTLINGGQQLCRHLKAKKGFRRGIKNEK